MAENKNVSRLNAHVLNKKKGIVATPLNNALGNLLQPNSWTKERMPEYLWLGLILKYYGRKDGFAKSFQILYELSQNIPSLSHPRLSAIFNLADEEQKTVYAIICRHVDKKIISPLTILYRNSTHPKFNEYFFIPQLSFESRMTLLSETIKMFSPSQSFEATDLRFLAICLMLFSGKLNFAPHLAEEAKIFEKYPETEHDDERMRKYRPSVRSLESMHFIVDNQFITTFWKAIGMITPCKPWRIKFENNPEDLNEFISACQKILEYILATNKEKALTDDKFDIIMGSITYALKIFLEINNNSLGNSILGRHGTRSIIEIYIMLKYLLKHEAEKPEIWKEYKAYGIGKYKLVLLKARETEPDTTSHFTLPLIDCIVNEHKFEEFTDIDLKYFDKQGIREKSIDVGEKQLYDLFYDYDSNYAHGLWGAIRECAVLACDNANHQFYCIPDIYARQNLSDVKLDCIKLLKRIFIWLADIYQIPDAFMGRINK